MFFSTVHLKLLSKHSPTLYIYWCCVIITNTLQARGTMKKLRVWILALCMFGVVHAAAGEYNADTDWFRDAGYGVFMHFLPGNEETFALVDAFDADALAEQIDEAGAGYFVITLGQNSGYFNAPNHTYDRIAGYAAGERCADRDLPLELYEALETRGIRLMLYLPCQTPNRDVKAQAAFGLPTGHKDQPIDIEFAKKWARVIQEWSDRYGGKVSGWWFDGGYERVNFNGEIAEIYAAAAKHGNPHAIVTFNPGVKLIHYTDAEDYTAGELNEPFGFVPDARWVDGSQWHALTYLGKRWGGRDVRYPSEQWAEWVRSVVAGDGVATLDTGPNMDEAAGPVGAISPEHMEQFRAIREVVRGE